MRCWLLLLREWIQPIIRPSTVLEWFIQRVPLLELVFS